MAVKKQINASMDKFIDKGAAVKASKEKEFRNVLVRIPADILDELDAYLILNKPWVNRTQWIVEMIHEGLKRNIP